MTHNVKRRDFYKEWGYSKGSKTNLTPTLNLATLTVISGLVVYRKAKKNGLLRRKRYRGQGFDYSHGHTPLEGTSTGKSCV